MTLPIFSGKHFTDKAKDAKFQPSWIIHILVFFLVFTAAQIPQSIAMSVAMFTQLSEINPNAEQLLKILLDMMLFPNEKIVLVQLFSTIFPAVIIVIYCRFMEKRSLESMGIIKSRWALKYPLGFVLGFAMFTATLLLALAAGAISYSGADINNGEDFGVFVLFCLGWIIQGAEEEILCRGYFMSSLSSKLPLWAAVLVSSVTFSLLHIFNGGFNFIVFVNLTLTGIMFALLAIRFNSLFVCCGAHSAWNLVQGNFYGLPVSGMYNLGPSVFRFQLAAKDPEVFKNAEIWTGGPFGLEGSIGETIIMIAAICALLFIPKLKKTNN